MGVGVPWEIHEVPLGSRLRFPNASLEIAETPSWWFNHPMRRAVLSTFLFVAILGLGCMGVAVPAKAYGHCEDTNDPQYDPNECEEVSGGNSLDKAIDLLGDNDRKDFRKYTRQNVSFSRGCMFMCRSKKIMNDYYSSLFPWLERCESEFGFELEGYGLKRIYGFLAERYLSYWFKKYTKFKLMPIVFKDISDFDKN